MEAGGKPAGTDSPFPDRDPHASFSGCGQDKKWQKNGRQKNRRHLLPSMFLPTENGGVSVHRTRCRASRDDLDRGGNFSIRSERCPVFERVSWHHRASENGSHFHRVHSI
jgi:hypothetical protein